MNYEDVVILSRKWQEAKVIKLAFSTRTETLNFAFSCRTPYITEYTLY